MKHLSKSLDRRVTALILGILAFSALTFIILLSTSYTVHALPEYAARTGESCAVCHVSAGGGGPRTMRGLLWAAQGKPDKVPTLPGKLIAPGVTDGVELYQIACGGCHGLKGEGLSALRLVNTKISPNTIQRFTLQGIPKFGMPAFDGQFTKEQMDTLITFVAGISSGEIPPPPDSYPLPPPIFRCELATKNPACIHPILESGGN
jgi:mono/diheme cytochrome c family protein